MPETDVTVLDRQEHNTENHHITVTATSHNHKIAKFEVWDSAGTKIHTHNGTKPIGGQESSTWLVNGYDPFPITVDVHESAGGVGNVIEREERPDIHRHGPFYANGHPAKNHGVIPTGPDGEPLPDPQKQINTAEANSGPGKYHP
jgi:hypothetical protein